MPPKRAAKAAAEPANRRDIRDFAAMCSVTQGEGDDPTDELQAPILYAYAKTGALRSWQICIGRTGVDLDLSDIWVADPGSCYYYTVSAQVKDASGQPKPFKTIVSVRTILTAGKSAGRANATTALTQAILDARTVYNKKVDDGYKRHERDLLDRSHPVAFADLLRNTSRGEYPWRIGPAASEKYEKHEKKLPEIFEIQPKLDGTMAICVAVPAATAATAASPHPLLGETFGLASADRVDDKPQQAAASTSDSTSQPMQAAASGSQSDTRASVLESRSDSKTRIDLYSRGRETCESQDHIAAALGSYLREYPGIYVVGELWLPGHSLQEISGNARRLAGEDAIRLHFYIFDMFDPSRPELKRTERLEILREIFAAIYIADPEAAYAAMRDPKQPGPLHLVPTWRGNRDAGTVLYNRFVADGLEGAMMRDPAGRHEYDFDGEVRSMFILKRKPMQDAEWPVVGWLCGKGKETGLITWRCAQADRDAGGTPLADRPTFNASINMPDAPRRAIYSAFEEKPELFQSKFYGKLITIKYGGQLNAANGFPQQPKALYFRDPKVQADLVALFNA